ncbi:MAG: hypothetical protein ACR2NL_07690 [Acidimicrobiia bacterium]
MPFEITEEVRPTHVILRAVGEYSLEMALDLIESAFVAASREGTSGALIDVRGIEGMPAGIERFEIGSLVAEHGKDGVRLAMVAKPEVAERAKFSEDVAANRGGLFAAFSQMEAAVAWLEEAG